MLFSYSCSPGTCQYTWHPVGTLYVVDRSECKNSLAGESDATLHQLSFRPPGFTTSQPGALGQVTQLQSPVSWCRVCAHCLALGSYEKLTEGGVSQLTPCWRTDSPQVPASSVVTAVM